MEYYNTNHLHELVTLLKEYLNNKETNKAKYFKSRVEMVR